MRGEMREEMIMDLELLEDAKLRSRGGWLKHPLEEHAHSYCD